MFWRCCSIITSVFVGKESCLLSCMRSGTQEWALSGGGETWGDMGRQGACLVKDNTSSITHNNWTKAYSVQPNTRKYWIEGLQIHQASKGVHPSTALVGMRFNSLRNCKLHVDPRSLQYS